MSTYGKVAFAAVIGFTVLLTGCNKPKSPEAVQSDVNAAERREATAVADARKDASNDVGNASDKVDEKTAQLNNAEAKGAYDVAVAKADGEHKVTLAKCEALAGDAQKKCKDQADADYDAAKAEAKARETAHTQ